MRRLALVAGLLALPAPAMAGPSDAIRTGGPSGTHDAKVAIVGSARDMRGARFRVIDAGGKTVMRGRLRRAPGSAGAWRHASAADLSRVAAPGQYRVVVGRLRSR